MDLFRASKQVLIASHGRDTEESTDQGTGSDFFGKQNINKDDLTQHVLVLELTLPIHFHA